MRMNERGGGLVALLGHLALGEVRASRTRDTDCMYVVLWVCGYRKEDTSFFARKGYSSAETSLYLYGCHESSAPHRFPDTGIRVEFERKPLFELAVAWIHRMQVGAVIPMPMVAITKDCWS